MQSVPIQHAKLDLSRLVDAALAGEEIVITKSGKSAVRLVPVKLTRPVRQPGALLGRINIADDFGAPLPDDLLRAFDDR